MSAIFDDIKESLTMRQVAEHFGHKVTKTGFILSPFHVEKTPSCKLYQNSYYDFATGDGGDLIQFTAAETGANNWQACKYLIEAFNLPFSLSGGIDNREEIERRKREREWQREKEERFMTALYTEIDRLKMWQDIYTRLIEAKIYSPLSEEQAFIVLELQKASYKLDVLCEIEGNKADIEKLLQEAGYTI